VSVVEKHLMQWDMESFGGNQKMPFVINLYLGKLLLVDV